jgi:hypothetical protein
MVSTPYCQPRRGFTQAELGIVIGITLVLSCLMLPAVVQIRDCAWRVQSSNNLHQLGIACNTCAEHREGHVPSAYGAWPGGGFANPPAIPTFFYYILPYIEQQRLYEVPDSTAYIKTCYSPNDPGNSGTTNHSSYAVNSSIFPPDVGALYPSDFKTKGATNQILFFERYAVTGYTDHTWSSIATFGNPQMAVVDGATAGPCLFKPDNTEITTALTDRTAHAFSPRGILVCVADTSTRMWSTSANNAYTYTIVDKDGRRLHVGTTFTWACDSKTVTGPPADGSW